ncbi:MAG: DUF5110 domain-containing protein, partial [Bacteroidetes bacterium]|nr:DUF5110 domain-containing protein [Bacteroidota bacterium]
TVFGITCKVFGDAVADSRLFEDDGLTYDYQRGVYNEVVLSAEHGKGKVVRKGNYKGKKYDIRKWEYIK